MSNSGLAPVVFDGARGDWTCDPADSHKARTRVGQRELLYEYAASGRLRAQKAQADLDVYSQAICLESDRRSGTPHSQLVSTPTSTI